MAEYPTDHLAVTTAIMAWEPPAEIESAAEAARAHGSPVLREVAMFDLLAPMVHSLDADALAILCGCAHLIGMNGFHGKGEQAITALLIAHGRLEALA